MFDALFNIIIIMHFIKLLLDLLIPLLLKIFLIINLNEVLQLAAQYLVALLINFVSSFNP